MQSAGRFAGKGVLVTGGASGIGEATAKRFLREGARVVIADRDDRHSMERALDEMRALGEVHGLRGDVSLPADADRLVADAVARLGRLDVLINNAGICLEEDFLEIPLEHWDATIAVNLRGMFLMGQRAARAMVDAGGGGAIVNTSSTNGIVGEAKYAHYNASKGGVTLLTKSMAIDLAPHGIRVNAVCPGYILTPMAAAIDSEEFVAEYIKKFIPLGRAGKPEEVAALFAFLASNDASFITGECVVIDGGQLTF
jgi:3-oxoacyl-[acyl-carrier protein] reductase